MKSRNIASLIVIYLILLAGNILAQGMQRGQQMQAARMDTLKSRLNLTDEQFSQIQGIFAKSREDMAQVRENNKGDRDAMRQAMKDNTDKTYSQIEKILSPDQLKKFQVIKEDWKKQSEERMKSMRKRNINN